MSSYMAVEMDARKREKEEGKKGELMVFVELQVEGDDVFGFHFLMHCGTAKRRRWVRLWPTNLPANHHFTAFVSTHTISPKSSHGMGL